MIGVTIVRVPAYSPYAVAEHTVALILALNRKIPRAYARVRDGNFALDGLLGFDLRGRTVGIVGTGKVGAVVAQIMAGFGCNLLAYDPYPNQACEGARRTLSAVARAPSRLGHRDAALSTGVRDLPPHRCPGAAADEARCHAHQH